MKVVVPPRALRSIRGAAWEAKEQGNDELPDEIYRAIEDCDTEAPPQVSRELIDECVESWHEGPVEELIGILVNHCSRQGIELIIEGTGSPRRGRSKTSSGLTGRSRGVLLLLASLFLVAIAIVFWRYQVAAERQAIDETLDWGSRIKKLAQSDPLHPRAITDPTIDIGKRLQNRWVQSIDPDHRNPAVIPESSGQTAEVVRSKASPRKVATLPRVGWLDVRSGMLVVGRESELPSREGEYEVLQLSSQIEEPATVLTQLDMPSLVAFESDTSIIIRFIKGVSLYSLSDDRDVRVVSEDAVAIDWDERSYFVASQATLDGRRQIADVRITRIPRSGGVAPDLYHDLPPVRELEVEGEELVFIGRGPAEPSEGQLSYSAGYLGRASATNTSDISWTIFETQRPRSVELTRDSIYLLTEGTLEGHLNDGLVIAIPRSGDDWRVLASEQPMPDSFVVGDGSLCWAVLDTLEYSVRCVSTSGGPVIEVGRGRGQARALSIDESKVYWIDGVTSSSIYVAEIP